jgi:hypothetical protein
MSKFAIQPFQFADKLGQAKSELGELEILATKMDENWNAILIHGWQLGRILIELKEEIGHGKWQFWLRENWPQLEERFAQRCMAFFRTKENWKMPAAGSVKFVGFDREAVRQFRGGYTLVKERLELEGDREIRRAPHHLMPVNQFSKYFRQVRSGQVEWPAQIVFRREIEQTLEQILTISGANEFRVTPAGIIWT